jgi:DNA-directed RNA polymerase subunit beta'
MNRMRIAATSRDVALRASYKKLQESLIAPETAVEEHAAELAQGPEAAIGDDVLAKVIADDLTTEDAAIDDVVESGEEE